MTEIQARTEDVKQSVASYTTCTSITVSHLKSLLFPVKAGGVAQHAKNLSGVPAIGPRKAQPKTASRIKSRKAPQISVLEAAEEEIPMFLTVRDQEKLATEILNTILKSLTEAVKAPPPTERTCKGKPTSGTTRPGSATYAKENTLHTQRPLQPLCLNKVLSEKHRSKVSPQARCSDGTQVASGLIAQGECARLALSALRSYRFQSKTGNKSPSLQLETASSVLIGKLIVLGALEPALAELRILRNELLTAGDGERAALSRNGKGSNQESTVDLLNLPPNNLNGPTLDMAVTLQFHVLRLLAAKRDASLTEAAVQHLHTKVHYSPANLIKSQHVPTDPASSHKVAGQLEALSRLMLSMCSDQLNSEDNASPGCRPVSPFIVLQYHLLALESRSLWWTIAQHKGDYLKDMLQPFGQFLSIYRRRCTASGEKGYLTAKDLLLGQVLFSGNEKISLSKSAAHDEAWRLIYSELFEIARKACLDKDTVLWAEKWITIPVNVSLTPCQRCSLICQQALMYAQITQGSHERDASRALQDAQRHLVGDLDGSSEELDELFHLVARLRKCVASIINKFQATPHVDRKAKNPELILHCFDICVVSLQFLHRYIGTRPSESLGQRLTHRYAQRLEQALPFTRAWAESVILIARFWKSESSDHWSRVAAGLQQCLHLATVIPDMSDGEPKPSVSVSVSNAYWSRYLFLKQANDGKKEILEALTGSVKAVRPCSLKDKLVAQLQMRLEQLAMSLEANAEYHRAANHYKELVALNVEMGALQQATLAAAKQPPRTILSSRGGFGSLGRGLSSYPRLATTSRPKSNTTTTFFDDDHLDPCQRGLALEHQLASLISLSGSQAVDPLVRETIQNVEARLLDTYSAEKFPVRRLRVLDTLLWLHSIHPEISFPTLEGENLENLVSAIRNELYGFDEGLQLLINHLDASRHAASAIHEDDFTQKQKKLAIALTAWEQLIEQFHDPETLEMHIGDIDVWLVHLELLSQYLEAQGFAHQRLSILRLLVVIRERSLPVHHAALITNLVQLGLQLLELDYVSQAGLAFHRAQKHMSEVELTADITIFFNVAYASYFFKAGIIARCEEQLAHAQKVFERGAKQGQNGVGRELVQLHHSMVDVIMLYSSLAARYGRLPRAFLLARQALHMCCQAWKTAERRQKSLTDKVEGDSSCELSRLEDSMSTANLSQLDSVKHGNSSRTLGPTFWRLGAQLHKALMTMAELYEHGGIFSEARLYGERSLRNAEAASAPGLQIASLNYLIHLSICSGDYTGAHCNLELIEARWTFLDANIQLLSFQINMTKFHCAKGHFSAAEQSCTTAESLVQRLAAARVAVNQSHGHNALDGLQEQLSALTLGDIAVGQPIKNKRLLGKGCTSRTKEVCNVATTSASGLSNGGASLSSMCHLGRNLLRQRVMLAIRQNKLEHAKELLDELTTQLENPQEVILQSILRAEILTEQGVDAMSDDPIFCMLPESSVSLPSVLASKVSVPPQPPKAAPVRGRRQPVKRVPVEPSTIKQIEPHKNGHVPYDMFQQAQTEINKVYESARTRTSTASLHHLSKILSKDLLMLSALSLTTQGTFQPSSTLVSSVADVARSISALRGRLATQAEQKLLPRNDLDVWPCKSDDDVDSVTNSDDLCGIEAYFEPGNDIIPQDWQVLTISLSRGQGELLVSRIRSGQNPFILSLPLNRHSSRDPHEDGLFSFFQAKRELQEIIALADNTTHSTQDTSGKGAKLSWWEKRTALDARLKDLLINMENIWFGGFQGILSPQVAPRELLSRFQASLNAALDNTLPSRQGSGKKHKPQQLNLDPRVIELFVALGDPVEIADMEESLTDLLYFVVDILQFNGERNAYDEIDFDSLTIDVVDALRRYHEAKRTLDELSTLKHTILVLDKELNCFPWESLPSLHGQAVSRLPSLGCLYDRILQQRRKTTLNMALGDGEKFCVNSRNGAYVLNPEGDLKATQTTFEESLIGMKGWDGSIRSIPSEEKLQGYLHEKDIFLYFGHGSGSQYIRRRTIRKLDKCGVALLMGCSSGKLTEAGDFEPYGTPMDYMQAGCPAMVVTLWDVTDKDIDRFSETMLQKWGLFQGQPPLDASPVKKTARQRGKSKVRQSPPPPIANMSLDQAVAQGRGSCIFRYLNGAAPVVYGIPIFLS
ncbi:MAG: hypothetical protein Q9222_001368 [Ikaeria aurantiellina]